MPSVSGECLTSTVSEPRLSRRLLVALATCSMASWSDLTFPWETQRDILVSVSVFSVQILWWIHGHNNIKLWQGYGPCFWLALKQEVFWHRIQYLFTELIWEQQSTMTNMCLQDVSVPLWKLSSRPTARRFLHTKELRLTHNLSQSCRPAKVSPGYRKSGDRPRHASSHTRIAVNTLQTPGEHTLQHWTNKVHCSALVSVTISLQIHEGQNVLVL